MFGIQLSYDKQKKIKTNFNRKYKNKEKKKKKHKLKTYINKKNYKMMKIYLISE